VLAQLFRYHPVQDLDAVFISHYHHDHMADVGCLQYAIRLTNNLNKAQKTLPIYGHPHSEIFAQLTAAKDQVYTQGIAVDDGQTIELNGLQVRFMKTVHEQYNLAMRFEYQGKSLVYTGDGEYQESLIDFARGCDLLVCEACLFAAEKGVAPGHMTSVEAAEIAAKAGAGKLMLTHFPHFSNIEQLKLEAEQRFTGPVELAQCGKVIHL